MFFVFALIAVYILFQIPLKVFTFLFSLAGYIGILGSFAGLLYSIVHRSLEGSLLFLVMFAVSFGVLIAMIKFNLFLDKIVDDQIKEEQTKRYLRQQGVL